VARETIVDAFTSGAFASPSYIGKRAKVLARDWSPEFSLALSLKDAQLNVELQDEVGMRLDVLRAIARAVKSAVASGLGEEDLYAIEKWFAASAAPPRGPSKRSR
jgi:3-hydroxyisobutyrate dehydrogenase-like beta-hydroxyacid dehydrogenase